MYDTLMVVDQYQRYHDGLKHSYRVDTKREAQLLAVWLHPFGQSHRRLAIIDQNDKDGQTAYSEAGFVTVTMNGDRPIELNRIIADELWHLRKQEEPPSQVIIVTDDPQFDLLCAGLDRDETKVSVWSPTNNVPSAFARYDHWRLDELLKGSTRIEVDKWLIFVDYENIHIGLEKRGWQPNPKDIIDAITKVTGDSKIISMAAYADWDMLARGTTRNYQRELAELGVKTRYQINMRGKNSADMEIVSDIHSMLASPDIANIIAVVSRDRDFRPVLDHIKKTKKAVVLTLKEGLSRELEQAADEVYFLDDHITIAKPKPIHHHRSGPPNPREHMAEFAIRLAGWLYRQHWKWVYADRLHNRISEVGPYNKEDVEAAVSADLLITVPDRPNALAINSEHPLGKTAKYLAWYLPNRIDYCLNQRGMPYVDTNYIATGMQRDQKLQTLGVAQSWHYARQWLELAEKAGIVESRQRSQAETPENTVTTWWLPGQAPKDIELQGKTRASAPAQLAVPKADQNRPLEVNVAAGAGRSMTYELESSVI